MEVQCTLHLVVEIETFKMQRTPLGSSYFDNRK